MNARVADAVAQWAAVRVPCSCGVTYPCPTASVVARVEGDES